LHVVLGEMVPKNATLAAPESSALWLAPVLAAVVRMLRPFIWLLNAASNATVRLLRVTPRSEVASTVTSDELVGVVTQSHREGLLPAEDLGLLANAISFETATAGDLAIPLEQVHTLPPGASADAVEERAAATGATRLPVRDDSAQPVLTGYIHLRDVLAVPVGQRDEPLPVSVIRDLPAMSETLPLADAVELFRARRTHIARVHPAGAAGVTAGVITLDDILVSLVQD
jgi:CBS domain containing-hemolysin-like protein